MASRAGRTFRVFVSSTFADLKAERDALQRYVFPRLRELCLRHACRFQAIDLRWGVRDEAALDQMTMRICLDEIARCQRASPRPNFIVLLGDRYGWRPLPWRIPAAELEMLRTHFSASADAALVSDWYRRDDNAVPPAYILRPRLLSDEARRGITPEGRAERDAEAAAWAVTERRLRDVLRAALDKTSFDDEAREKYLASATEQEITRGAMAPADAGAHVFAFVRVIPALTTGTEIAPEARDFVDTIETGGTLRIDEEARRLLNDLRDVRLPARLPGHVHRYQARFSPAGEPGPPVTTDHIGRLPDSLDACLALAEGGTEWPGLCRDVWMRLSSTILAEIAALEAEEPLDREIAAHREFGAERRRSFVGREAALEAVAAYVASDARTPFAVLGASGSGKSAFLALAGERARPLFAPGPVILRFVGATPDSTNGRSLLERICAEVARAAGEAAPAEGTGFRELTREFPRLLEAAGRGGRLLVIIDALDQLSEAENARELLWLPESLPPNVKIIVSALPGDSADALARKLPPDARLTLEPMTKAEGGALLDTWLAEEGRALTPDQRALVLDRFATEGRPLFLKLAADHARRWPSFAPAGSLTLPDSIPGLLDGLFDRLASDANHGAVLVSRSLGYLAAAKNGLSEDELLDVLSADEDVHADFIARARHEPPERRLPVVVWSRLFFDLEAHLVERSADGASLIGFYHRQFAEAARSRYLGGSDAPGRHARLAAYFGSGPLTVERDGGRAPQLRKLSELAYQQIHAGLWDSLRVSLADLDFLQAKVEAGLLDDALADFEALRMAFPGPGSSTEDSRTELRSLLTTFASAFNQEFHAFRRDPRIAAQQIYANIFAQEAFDGPAGVVLEAFHRRNAYPGGGPWLRRLNRAPRTSPSRDLRRTIGAHDEAIAALDVSADGAFLATGAADGTVRIWNAASGTQKGGFAAHAGGVTALRFLPSPEGAPRLASGGRDGLVRLWDWRAEREILSWKAHADRVRAFYVFADGRRLASCGDEPRIKLWDLTSRPPGLRELEGHKDRIFAVASNAAGRILVSGGEDRTVAVWNLAASGESKTLRGHESAIQAIGLGPDKDWAASGADDGRLKIWDLAAGRERLSVDAHRRRITGIAVSPDGSLVATSGEDGEIKVWDSRTLELTAAFRGHAGGIRAVAFEPGGRGLASGGTDGTLRLWDLTGTRRKSEPSWEHEGAVIGLSRSPEAAGFVATAGEDSTVRVWDDAGGDHRTTLRGHIGAVNAVLGLGPNTLVSGGADRTLRVWDIGASRLVRTLGNQLAGAIAANSILAAAAGPGLGGHSGPVTCLARLGPDTVVSGSRDGTLRTWEISSGREVRVFQGARGLVEAVVADPGRGLVVSAGTSPDLVVWSAPAGTILSVWKGHASGVTCLSFPAGSELAASGGLDRTVRVWSVRDGTSRVLSGHTDRIAAVALEPGLGIVVSAGCDTSVRLWDAGTGSALGVLAGHKAAVRALAIDGPAGRLISGGDDGSVIVWEIESGRRLARIDLGAPVAAVGLLDAGRVIAGLKSGGVAAVQLE